MTTTVSIVTPSYNQCPFIGETIESVLGQDGDFHLDYVIVDGGSTDGSREVIRRYAALIDEGKWPVRCRGIRYRWVSETDEGQTDAIVKGFGMAEGTIFAWLNSDDTLLPGAIGKIVDRFHADPSLAMVYGRVHFTDPRGEAISEVETGPTDYAGLASLNLVCQPGAFFRKSALAVAGGLNRDLHYAMDHDLWIRMSRHCKLTYVPELLATYRLHPHSKTRASRHALEFQRETLEILMKHYGRAPLNRVYAYCAERLRFGPMSFRWSNLVVLLPAALWTAGEYIRLNRRIHKEDIQMIRPANLRKLFRGRIGAPLKPGQ